MGLNVFWTAEITPKDEATIIIHKPSVGQFAYYHYYPVSSGDELNLASGRYNNGHLTRFGVSLKG